jgi:NADPH:quinone reductase-like Zn-dependent oxidoreductase
MIFMGNLRQIQLFSPGKRGHFKVVESDLKSLKSGKIRISVHYSGLNFADVMMKLGLYPDAPKAPFCPGYEISGVVTALAPDVETNNQGLRVGDHVMAGLHFGGHADTVDVPWWQVRKISPDICLKKACAVPVSGLTADMALHELARVRKEDVVMIDCASGALGMVMIEILKDLGVKTIFGLTSKNEKLSVIKERGAIAVLDRDWQAPQYKADLIINSRGGESLLRHRQSLNPLGRMVCLGASHMVGQGQLSYMTVLHQFLSMKKISTIDLMNENRGVFGLNVLKLFERPEVLSGSLHRVCDLFEEGKIQVALDRLFLPQEAEAAWEHLGTGKSQGKVLIKWRDD